MSKEIVCPYCKSVAVKPPSRDPEVDYLWILHADSPLRKLKEENERLLERVKESSEFAQSEILKLDSALKRIKELEEQLKDNDEYWRNEYAT